MGGREKVTPAEAADPSHAFGLLPRHAALRVGPGAEGAQPHVLVCAPSNSALDEIVLRIITNGLIDANGEVGTASGVCPCDVSMLVVVVVMVAVVVVVVVLVLVVVVGAPGAAPPVACAAILVSPRPAS